MYPIILCQLNKISNEKMSLCFIRSSIDSTCIFPTANEMVSAAICRRGLCYGLYKYFSPVAAFNERQRAKTGLEFV
jgi:hypothetical protein